MSFFNPEGSMTPTEQREYLEHVDELLRLWHVTPRPYNALAARAIKAQTERVQMLTSGYLMALQAVDPKAPSSSTS